MPVVTDFTEVINVKYQSKFMNNLSEKIIVALDVSNLEEAIALVKELPEVSFWKVGLELFVATGAEILQFLKEEQKRIFLDLKFHDIPNTVRGAVKSALKYQVDLLTIHVNQPAPRPDTDEEIRPT